MAAPAKFLFDNDFGRGAPAGRASPAQHQAEIAEAEARGYRNGVAAAQAETSRALATALRAIAGTLEQAARNMNAVEERMEAEAVEVAVAVAGKLSAELLAREPLAEVAALATECFRHLVGVPHVVVRVGSDVYDEARARLEEIAEVSGFGGRLAVLAEPELGASDCRIEWADGGAVRDHAALQAAIAEAVQRYLTVRRGSTNGAATSEVVP
jgi:flagellar assembly protein FliH